MARLGDDGGDRVRHGGRRGGAKAAPGVRLVEQRRHGRSVAAPSRLQKQQRLGRPFESAQRAQAAHLRAPGLVDRPAVGQDSRRLPQAHGRRRVGAGGKRRGRVRRQPRPHQRGQPVAWRQTVHGGEDGDIRPLAAPQQKQSQQLPTQKRPKIVRPILPTGPLKETFQRRRGRQPAHRDFHGRAQQVSPRRRVRRPFRAQRTKVVGRRVAERQGLGETTKMVGGGMRPAGRRRLLHRVEQFGRRRLTLAESVERDPRPAAQRQKQSGLRRQHRGRVVLPQTGQGITRERLHRRLRRRLPEGRDRLLRPLCRQRLVPPQQRRQRRRPSRFLRRRLTRPSPFQQHAPARQRRRGIRPLPRRLELLPGAIVLFQGR